MSLDEKFASVRTAFYDLVGNFFKGIAGLFGYPTNPGMPTMAEIPRDQYARSSFIDSLPVHRTSWPPIQRPETWFEMIFGPTPKLESVPRYIYESKEEGFYNFYIENYKNIYFLPDWFSTFIQVKLNICLDISVLETIREIVFIGLVVYAYILILRLSLSWFIYINPYTVPWCYLAAAVDWTEDLLQGIVPSVLGVNITGSVFLGMLGVLADSLNHLVFTMPFLPSEGEETKLLLNEQMRNVLVFHYLPILWYRHPIPNDIREFWYKERPDILEYMEKAYQDLDIQFLPDDTLAKLDQGKLTSLVLTSPIDLNSNFHDFDSTELLSSVNFISTDSFLTQLNHLIDYFI